METDSMKCPNCNGELIINEAQSYYECPFCGSKQKIVESDAVKKARIQSELEKEKIKADNEYKLKKEEINSTVNSIKETVNALDSGMDLLVKGDQLINKTKAFLTKLAIGIVLILILIIVAAVACHALK